MARVSIISFLVCVILLVIHVQVKASPFNGPMLKNYTHEALRVDCESDSDCCNPECVDPESRTDSGFDCCNDKCVDLQSDPDNCGSCFVKMGGAHPDAHLDAHPQLPQPPPHQLQLLHSLPQQPPHPQLPLPLPLPLPQQQRLKQSVQPAEAPVANNVVQTAQHATPPHFSVPAQPVPSATRTTPVSQENVVPIVTSVQAWPPAVRMHVQRVFVQCRICTYTAWHASHGWLVDVRASSCLP
ncbi:hypothetical protein TMatcc_009691 [Talaromyces marneffei ATCC 18224]